MRRLLAAVCLMGFLGLLVACGGGAPVATTSPAVQAKPEPPPVVSTPQAAKRTTPLAVPMLREDFRKAVVGMDQEEVLASLGKPTRTYDRSDGTPSLWSYDKKLTIDPITGKQDRKVDVNWGRDGKVERVVFVPPL